MRALLVGLVLFAVCAGCAALAGASLSPSETTGATSAATEQSAEATEPPPTGPVLPTTQPTGPSWTPLPAEPLLLNSAVRVIVDRLNVRDQPTVDSKSLGVVTSDDILVIDDYGPLSKDGYSWHHMFVFSTNGAVPDLSHELFLPDALRGWIAVGKGSEDYVTKQAPRCPTAIDVSNLRFMLGSERLACFGSNSIELTGTFGCGGCGGARPGTFEPSWLAHPMNYNLLSVYPVGERLGPFTLHFPPEGPDVPAASSVIRVRGHFDDAAASMCHISIGDPLRPDGEHLVTIPSDAAQLSCAQQFVVETVEVLGIDSGFVFG